MEEQKDNDLLEQDFTVEAVRGTRDGENGKEYLIKWAGFPEEENTWEREEDLLTDGIMEEIKARLADIANAAERKKNDENKMRKRVARRRRVRDTTQQKKTKSDEMRKRVARRRTQKTGLVPLTKFIAGKAAGAASGAAGKAADYGLAIGKFHAVLLQLLSEAASTRTLKAVKQGKKAVEKAWDDAGGSVERFVEQSAGDAEKFVKKTAKAAPSAALRAIADIAKRQKSDNTSRCKLPIGIPNKPGFYTRVETKVQAFNEAETASVTQKLNKVLLDACGDIIRSQEYEGDAEDLNTTRVREQQRQIEKIVEARDKLDTLFTEKEKLKAALENTFRDDAIDDLVVLLEEAAGAVDSMKQTQKDKEKRATRLREWFRKQPPEKRANLVKQKFAKANNKWKAKKHEVAVLCEKFKMYVAADPRLKGGSRTQQKQKEDIACMVAMTMIRVHDAANGERFIGDFGKITPAISETHDPDLTGYLTKLLKMTGVENGRIFQLTAGLEGALDQLYNVPWLEDTTKTLNKSTTFGLIAKVLETVSLFVYPPLAGLGEALGAVNSTFGTAFQRYLSIVVGIFLRKLETLWGSIWDSKEKIIAVKVWLMVQSFATNFIMNCVPWLFAVNPMLAKYGVQILQFVTGAFIAGVRAALLRTRWLNDPATMEKTFRNYQNNILRKRDITDADQINLRKLLTVRARNASFGADFLTRCFTLSDREVGFFLVSPLASAFFTWLGGSTLFSVVGLGAFTRTGSTDYDEQTHMAVCTDSACTTIQVYKVGNTTDVRTLTDEDFKGNFYKKSLTDMQKNMRNGSSMPNAAWSLVVKEYHMFRYLVARYANQQMLTGTWTGVFNALSAQWGSGEDTAINRALNYFVIPPSANPSRFVRFLESATNTAPPMRWLTSNQVKDLFEREQRKQGIEQGKKDKDYIKKISDEFQEEVIPLPTGAEKINRLQTLLDDAENKKISNKNLYGGGTVRKVIGGTLEKTRTKFAKELTGAVQDAMNEIMKKAGFRYSYPRDDTELTTALKKLDAGTRRVLRKQLQGALEECEKMFITCRMDIRRVFGGFNSKGQLLAGVNPVSYDTNKILQELRLVPAGEAVGGGVSGIRLTLDNPDARNARRELGGLQEDFAPDGSSVVTLPAGESKEHADDEDDGITIEDVDDDNTDTNPETGVEIVEDRESEVYIRGILGGEKDHDAGFQTWLDDPIHQKQLVDAAANEDTSPEKILSRLKHVEDALKGAKSSSELKKLKDRLSKEIDFARAAVEWGLETLQDKSIDEVKQRIRTAALSGNAADLKNANDFVRQLVENSQRRVQAGEERNPQWDGWRRDSGGSGGSGWAAISGGTVPPGTPVPSLPLLPPRPARLAAPSATQKLGIRRKRRVYAFSKE